jgi:hypothetical protein
MIIYKKRRSEGRPSARANSRLNIEVSSEVLEVIGDSGAHKTGS